MRCDASMLAIDAINILARLATGTSFAIIRKTRARARAPILQYELAKMRRVPRTRMIKRGYILHPNDGPFLAVRSVLS